MAEVWVADYPEISPRIAFRWAHNLSHQDVADRWNGLQAGEPTITKARIYEFEAWPESGRRPSVESLDMLARIYATTARGLLTDSEYGLYDNNARPVIDRIDYRALDEHQKRGFLDIVESESFPILLITRPKIVHPIDGKEMLLIEGGNSGQGIASSFYMDATVITNEDYARFVSESGHAAPAHWSSAGSFPSELRDHPVVNVSHGDAMAYACWAHKRLPTVAEWELAAGGPERFAFPWGERASIAKCNVRESGIHATTPVAKYRSGVSPFGMYDMSGNVWEWCSTQTTPGRFVLKGSAFTSPFEAARIEATNDADAEMSDDDTGFRCVCTPAMLESIE